MAEKIEFADWGEAEVTDVIWMMATPYDDLADALCAGRADFAITDIEEVEKYWIAYHDTLWDGGVGGTELSMYVLARLKDGRWLTVEAGNDYTGWGCQDFSNVDVFDTREDAVKFGLTSEARNLLGEEI